jgi:hypothetical protein
LLSHLRVQVGTGVTNAPFLEIPKRVIYDRCTTVYSYAAAAQENRIDLLRAEMLRAAWDWRGRIYGEPGPRFRGDG